MKKTLLLIITSLTVSACDPGGLSIIEVKNSSSYNLQIDFLESVKIHTINLPKNETTALELSSLGGYINPNYQFNKIIFTDTETGNLIKELAFTEEDELFTFIKKENRRKIIAYWVGYFTIEINEKLLKGEP